MWIFASTFKLKVMKFKFLTFSIMLIFAACSFGTAVQTANEPHKQMTEILELLKKDEDDDNDDDDE